MKKSLTRRDYILLTVAFLSHPANSFTRHWFQSQGFNLYPAAALGGLATGIVAVSVMWALGIFRKTKN